jgi:hypothetical protein
MRKLATGPVVSSEDSCGRPGGKSRAGGRGRVGWLGGRSVLSLALLNAEAFDWTSRDSFALISKTSSEDSSMANPNPTHQDILRS